MNHKFGIEKQLKKITKNSKRKRQSESAKEKEGQKSNFNLQSYGRGYIHTLSILFLLWYS